MHDVEIPHILGNQHADRGEVVRFTCFRFLVRSPVRGGVNPRAQFGRNGMASTVEDPHNVIGNRIRYLPAFSVVPQLTALPLVAVDG